jgi:2-methylcitrate dehydratase PrpD
MAGRRGVSAQVPVTITMKDGRKLTKLVEKVRGSPGNPMTREELLGKYRGCASASAGRRAPGALDRGARESREGADG